jgi:5-hydroxyisourate hydrolase-like protein (transthyretin family)
MACLLPAAAAAQTGTVTGTVTSSATGLPLAGVTIRIVTLNLNQVAQATTDAAGMYSVTNVPPGALYYVAATPPVGHVDELYPDVKKARNSLSTLLMAEATPIAVAGGATVSGIDFALDAEGRIAGTVTNASGGAPLSSVIVFAYTRVGTSLSFFTSASTNASGAFTLIGLPSGSYYVHTSNSQGFRDEAFDNVPCVGFCQTSTIVTGTPVAVASGSTTSGRDFALDLGGTVTGIVTNASTGAPVQNVGVQAYTMVGSSTVSAGSANTNAMGEYTIRGLTSGAYYLLTAANNLTNEIHDNLLCPLTCSSTTAVNSGTSVGVTLGAETNGIDFALDPGGAISGTVTNEVTGLPASGVQIVAVVQVGGSTFNRSAVTSASGQYSIMGLPTGAYALYTSSSQFANEIYDNIPCSGFCSVTTAFNTGTLVSVTAGGTTADRDFVLQPVAGGSITGVVTDADSGLPVAGVGVEIWRPSGASLNFVTTATTNVAGVYTAQNLPGGSYLADTFGLFGSHTFRNEVFDNIPCFSNFCSFTAIASGTPIVVTGGGGATADFGLSKGDGVLGTITAAATGLPLPSVTVQLYRSPSGDFAGSYSTNAAGQFFLNGVPNGTYVAFTSNSLGFRNEIFNDIPCSSSCSIATALSSGTPITITDAAAFVAGAPLVSGINFALNVRTDAPGAPTNLRIVTSGSIAQFSWSAPSLTNAAAPTSYLLEAGGSPGTTFITLPVPGTGTSFSVSNVPPGTFYLRIRGVNGTVQGPASNEVRLAVGAGGLGLPDAPTNLAASVNGSLLTMTWNAPQGGGPPSGYIVEAGTASGASNIASLAVTTARFTYTPVPSGFFFLRVRARNAAGVSVPSAEVMIVAGGVASPPRAPNFSSHSVSGSTVTLNWQAPPRSTPTSYIIEAGSASGLSNLGVFHTGTTALTASFSGVPPGTYYVRIRAVNAQGASVVSNERTITVS